MRIIKYNATYVSASNDRRISLRTGKKKICAGKDEKMKSTERESRLVLDVRSIIPMYQNVLRSFFLFLPSFAYKRDEETFWSRQTWIFSHLVQSCVLLYMRKTVCASDRNLRKERNSEKREKGSEMERERERKTRITCFRRMNYNSHFPNPHGEVPPKYHKRKREREKGGGEIGEEIKRRMMLRARNVLGSYFISRGFLPTISRKPREVWLVRGVKKCQRIFSKAFSLHLPLSCSLALSGSARRPR